MGITNLKHMKEAKKGNKAAHLRNCLRYIFNPEKTEGGTLTGGSHCPSFTWQAAYDKMMSTKRFFNKTNGRQGYHFVLSFQPDEHVSKELCKTITEEFIAEYLKDDYEAVYAVHTDQPHMHSHIVFNSVKISDGLKYHYAKGDWARYIQPITNRICKKYGLKQIVIDDRGMFDNLEEDDIYELSDYFYEPEKRGINLTHDEAEKRNKKRYTVLQHIQKDIDRLAPQAKSYEELLELLKAEGYRVRGTAAYKHLSISPPYEENFYRTDSLGDAYKPDGLRDRIAGIRPHKPYKPDYELEDDDNTFVPDEEKEKPGTLIQQSKNALPQKQCVGVRFSRDTFRVTNWQMRYVIRAYKVKRFSREISYTDNWKYSKDLERLDELLAGCRYLIKEDIHSRKELSDKKQTLTGKRYLTKTERNELKLINSMLHRHREINRPEPPIEQQTMKTGRN